MDIRSEADVEQKYIIDILMSGRPKGLGIPSDNIRPQETVATESISKGSSQKRYRPDYVVVYKRIPLAVVEAKAPDVDERQGMEEAKMYARIINGKYPSGLNPTRRVISSNYENTLYGYWDQEEEEGSFSPEQRAPTESAYRRFLELFSADTLEELAGDLSRDIYSVDYQTPNSIVNESIKDRSVGFNQFGSHLALKLKGYFSPSTESERRRIVEKAYVKSRRREGYVNPIRDVIEDARDLTNEGIKTIDSSSPDDLIDKINTVQEKARNEDVSEVLLLVGRAGCGKSTFIDYLKQVALPTDLLDDTLWSHIDMENIRLTREDIYDRVTDKIKDTLEESTDEDLHDINVLKKIYAQEINDFKKGPVSLLDEDSEEYKRKISNYITSLRQDNETSLNAHFRYIAAQQGEVPIIVLDNVDKRERDDQLLMFEVAEWIQSNFRCIIVLPLREETYDNYRGEAPLDTAVKDLTFRIDAPPFGEVLSRRIDLILDDIDNWGDETINIETSDGTTFSYDPSRQADFLKAISNSLLQESDTAERLISGVSGMNLRRAIEMFLEFCKSGYLPESHIIRMCLSDGELTAPKEVTIRALIRGANRFYDEDNSFVKNIFSTREPQSENDHFLRYLALDWLNCRREERGPTKVKGYFKVSECISHLYRLGFDVDASKREISYLIESRCIIADHLDLTLKSEDDLIKITPVGITHLNILDNPQYLGAICEDTPIYSSGVHECISRRMVSSTTSLDNEKELFNARDFSDYLHDKRISFKNSLTKYSNLNDVPDLPDTYSQRSKVRNIINTLDNKSWDLFTSNYSTGDTIYGVVDEIHDDVIILGISRNVAGYIDINSDNKDSLNDISTGDVLKTRIQSVAHDQRRAILQVA